MNMICALQPVAGKTHWEKAWISVENEEILLKAVEFWDLSLGVATRQRAAHEFQHQAWHSPVLWRKLLYSERLMPRVLRTVIPRIRKSLRDRGFAASLTRSFLLPIHLLREYRAARRLRPVEYHSEFDRVHGVDTDGKLGGWTYLSDLDISSPNWIDGNDYLAIEPQRFCRVLASLDIAFEEYTFIDFGSGKGRALLLASEFPFKRVVGLEFSPELHRIAEQNFRQYRSETQKCRDIQSRNVDFANFSFPQEPLVLFLFDPCRARVLAEVMARIGQSLIAAPRPLYVAYVAPRPEHEELFASVGFLREIFRSTDMNFTVYASVARA